MGRIWPGLFFKLPVIRSLIVHVLGMVGCKYFINAVEIHLGAVEMDGCTCGKKNAGGLCLDATYGGTHGSKLAPHHPGFGVLESRDTERALEDRPRADRADYLFAFAQTFSLRNCIVALSPIIEREHFYPCFRRGLTRCSSQGD